jgi:hypothetical protein
MPKGAASSELRALPFHEATVIGLALEAASGELQLQGVYSESGLRLVTVYLENITLCEVDGEAVENLAMEASDGEVFTLDIREDGIELIVEWNEWSPARRQFVRAYNVHASSVRVEITP